MTLKPFTDLAAFPEGQYAMDRQAAIVPSAEPNGEAYVNWEQWLQQRGKNYQEYNSFSGVDIKAALWIPPHEDNPAGTFKTWGELQTITISSERPPGPVRCLGLAAARDYVRGVRTIAGTMIFTVLDKDAFLDVYQRSSREAPGEHPIFVDQIPPFHVILTGINEMGFQASMAVIGCQLTHMGMTFSVDDLLLESTYTYTALHVTPFANKVGWSDLDLKFRMMTSVETVSGLSKMAAAQSSRALRTVKGFF